MEIKIRKITTYDAEPLYRLLSDPKVMEYLEPAGVGRKILMSAGFFSR